MAEGEFFGLLGPNGAGKTTLISILAGLTRADSGTARILGHDVVTAYRAIAARAGRRSAGARVRPVLHGARDARDPVGLLRHSRQRRRGSTRSCTTSTSSSKANANMRSLSGGMKRRVLVGQALVHKPPVIVLDEPTAGVDVELRQSLWEFIRKLNRDGHTIILTTHYLEEAEALCGRIAMLKAGKVVALDTKQNLLSRFAGLTVRLVAERVPAAWQPRVLRQEAGVHLHRPRPLRRPRGAARRAARPRASPSTSSRCRRPTSSRCSSRSWRRSRRGGRRGGADAMTRIAGAGWLTLLYKELLRFWKVSFQTILAPVLTALLYLLIFSHVLERNVSVFDGKVSYTAFLVPGLVMMSVLQNAFANTSSSLMQSKMNGNLIFILLPPLSPLELFARVRRWARWCAASSSASACSRSRCSSRRRSCSCRIRSGRSGSRCSAARSSARWGSSPPSGPRSSTRSRRSRTSSSCRSRSCPACSTRSTRCRRSGRRCRTSIRSSI